MMWYDPIWYDMIQNNQIWYDLGGVTSEGIRKCDLDVDSMEFNHMLNK